MSVAALLLAAGHGRRFAAANDASKLVQDLAGEPMVRRAANVALASRAAPLVVVTGHAEAQIRDALAGLPLSFVHNPDHATGMASSLATGVRALPAHSTGALMLLADMPRVSPTTLETLIARFEEASTRSDAVIPSFAGKPGNPVLIGRSLFPDIARLEGDEGARRLLFEPGRAIVECDVDDEGITVDVDTVAALETLRDKR